MTKKSVNTREGTKQRKISVYVSKLNMGIQFKMKDPVNIFMTALIEQKYWAIKWQLLVTSENSLFS